MSNSGSVLVDFSMVPARAAGDRRLRGLHFGVLMAVCRAVNSNTGIAVISVDRISVRTGRNRSNVYPKLEDLIDWGYLEKIKRGRRIRGQFLTNSYRIIYEENHVPTAGDVDHVLPAGDKTMSPTEDPDSYPYNSKPSSPPKSIDGGEVVQDEVKKIVDAFIRLRLIHWPKEYRKPAPMSKLQVQAQAWTDRGCPAELAIEIIDRVMKKNVKDGQHYAPNNLGFCDQTMDSQIALYNNAGQKKTTAAPAISLDQESMIREIVSKVLNEEVNEFSLDEMSDD